MSRVGVKHTRSIFFFVVLFVFVLTAQTASSARKKKSSTPVYTPPPYEREAALKTLINPHEQINDAGEVLWNKCLICHKNVPDMSKEHSVKDVSLRIEKEVKEICYICHTVIQHPGAEGTTAVLIGRAAALHMVKLPQVIHNNLRLALKDIDAVMAFDPATGKVTCTTCHNPHERGVTFGKNNWGADSTRRLRSEGLDICQNCHRK